MKKDIVAVVILLGVLLGIATSFLACTSAEVPDQKLNEDQSKQEETTEETEKMPEDYELYKFPEVNSIEDAEQIGRLQLPAGAYIDNYTVFESGANKEEWYEAKPYYYELYIKIPIKEEEESEQFISYLQRRFVEYTDYRKNGEIKMASKNENYQFPPEQTYCFGWTYNAAEQGRFTVFMYFCIAVFEDNMTMWIFT